MTNSDLDLCDGQAMAKGDLTRNGGQGRSDRRTDGDEGGPTRRGNGGRLRPRRGNLTEQGGPGGDAIIEVEPKSSNLEARRASCSSHRAMGQSHRSSAQPCGRCRNGQLAGSKGTKSGRGGRQGLEGHLEVGPTGARMEEPLGDGG